MKDFSKLFETVMDFKGLSFLVTEKSLIKKQRPVFFLPLLDRRKAERRTDGQIPPVFYRTSSPSGPLPKSFKTLVFPL